MPNFNFSRNSLKMDKVKGRSKADASTPVLHEIQRVEDVKVLSFGKHLPSDKIMGKLAVNV